MKKKEKFIETLKKNLKFILLAVILMVIFHKYFLKISLFIGLAIMGVLSQQFSKLVPHISIESVSASAVFFGYVFGWKWGFAFGALVGMAGFIYVGLVKLTTITKSMMMGLSGILGAIFASLGLKFVPAFIICFLISSNLSYFVFSFLNSDKFENLTHAYGDSAFSVIITMQLLNIIYRLIQPFLGGM